MTRMQPILVADLPGRYVVRLTYVEPGYARARGIDEIPYAGEFEVRAFDPADAVRRATALFHDAARGSGVSWAREIQTATWRLIAD